MLKQIISASVVTAALLLNGCGADSAGEDRLAAQHAIDSGDAGVAIALLEPTPISDLNDTEKTAFLASISDTDKMTLASAYMKEADVSIMDIVSKLDTAEGETTFASIAEDIIGDGNASETADKVKSIDTAIAYYESMGSSATSAAPSFKASSFNDANITVEGAKLYLGMAYFSKVTMLISYFGDLALLEDDNITDPHFKATEDAFKCIYDNQCNGIGITSDVNLNFTDSSSGVGSRLDVTVDDVVYSRFTTNTGADLGSLLVADYKGYSDRYGSNNNSWIVSDFPFGTGYNFEDEVLVALNGAYTLILDQAPKDVRDEMELKFDEIDKDPKNYVISIGEIRAYMAK